MHPPWWSQVSWSPSSLHPATAIGVQVCHAGVSHLIALHCVARYCMVLHSIVLYYSAGLPRRCTSPQFSQGPKPCSPWQQHQLHPWIFARGAPWKIYLKIDGIFDFLYCPIFPNWPKLPKLKSHLRCSSKLKVHCPFLLPLQASTTALQIAFEQYFSLQNVFGFYENLY